VAGQSKRRMPIEESMAIIEREVAAYKAMLAEIRRRRVEKLVANALAKVKADERKREETARMNAYNRARYRRRNEVRATR